MGSRSHQAPLRLRLSEKALRRIWQQEGLLQKKRRKHRTKNDLELSNSSGDCSSRSIAKDLDDGPQIRRFRLPLVQYTAREVVSGLHFMAYAQQRSLSDARRFVGWLLEHLQSCGASLTGSRIQTDNGSESSAVGRPNPTVPSLAVCRPPACGIRPSLPALTPGRPTSKPPSLIEDEFIRWNPFRDAPISSTRPPYNLWFNTRRQNSYKANRTPWEVLHARDPTLPPKKMNSTRSTLRGV